MKIQIENTEYILNVEAAKKAGVLTLSTKLDNPESIEIGDVFIDPNHLHAVSVVAEIIINHNTCQKNRFQLFGACSNPLRVFSSSDNFFTIPHTLEEIASYLKENNMIFSHNCLHQLSGWSRKSV